MAQEINAGKKEFNEKYGWVKLCKDVGDYTNTSLFAVFKLLAVEVLAIAQMMIIESDLNQLKSTSN